MSDAKDKQVNEIDDSQESKEPKTEAIEYKVTCAVARQILIGLGVTVVCIIVGIVLAQWIGDLVRQIIKESENYFSDFLGGALGLSVGFLLDKICLEKINCIYKCKNFITAVTHELDNIQCKDVEGKSRMIVSIPKVEELNSGEKKVTFVEEEVTFDEQQGGCFKENGVKIHESEKTYMLPRLQEFILDDVVTSAETMSLIANLPVGTKHKLETVKFKNKFIDYLGGVHRLIGEYNEIVAKQVEFIENNKLCVVNNICIDGLRKMQELYNHINKFKVVTNKINTIWELKV